MASGESKADCVEHCIARVIFRDGKRVPGAFSGHSNTHLTIKKGVDMVFCASVKNLIGFFRDFRTGFSPNSDQFALTVPKLRCGL